MELKARTKKLSPLEYFLVEVNNDKQYICFKNSQYNLDFQIIDNCVHIDLESLFKFNCTLDKIKLTGKLLSKDNDLKVSFTGNGKELIVFKNGIEI